MTPINEPIIERNNLYRGVNPHLQSILQTPGDKVRGPSLWHSFHTNHITHIADFLNQQLPERYVARVEQSLQIHTEGDDFSADSRPIPDVTVFGTSTSYRVGGSAPLLAPTWTAELAATINWDVEDFTGAVIIRDSTDKPSLGRPLTRIELLSPSNTPGRSDYDSYRKNRHDALYTGKPLIELHYLHEYRAPIPGYPRYGRHDDAYAYTIFVSIPRPSILTGTVAAYGFDVDSPLPTIHIPLADDETIAFDFGKVYHYTYSTGRWGNMVNYRLLPERFETYSPADQARIEARMAAIAQMQTAEDS